MKSVYILLDSINKVKDFVNAVNKFDGDFDISSERYVIDAKSIMGIFSLDLSKKLRLDVHDDKNIEEITELLKNYIVE